MPKSYRKISPQEMAAKTIVYKDEKFTMIHSTAGWEVAGSAARYTNEKWSVLFFIDGIPHGQAFKTYNEATEFLNKKKGV